MARPYRDDLALRYRIEFDEIINDKKDHIDLKTVAPGCYPFRNSDEDHVLEIFMKTCLCVDDSPESRVIMGLFLKDMGYKVVFACAGYAAIAKLRERVFDIIVLDIQMPDLSGNAVASYVRAHPDHQKTKILSMTASADKLKLDGSLRAGANIALTKPIEFDLLTDTLECLNTEDVVAA